MDRFSDLSQLQRQSVALTIGTFDGVHRGHQQLMQSVKERAVRHGWRSAVLTFEPHPRAILRPEQPLVLLCTPADKAALIARQGVDTLITLPFTPELARLTTYEFAASIQARLEVKELWEGPDFTMGSDMVGVEQIALVGERLGFALHQIDHYRLAGREVRSTAIRNAIIEGDLPAAATMLGRYHSIQSEVVHGAQRGRTFGYPTANQLPPPYLVLPNNGIYATFAELEDGKLLPAATNVGLRPMFADGSRNVETYILDFDADIYGQQLRVHFVERLRGEEKFSSLDELIAQMGRDCAQARAILAAAR